MSVITLRLRADKHERLRQIAKQRGISVNRLLDEVTTIAPAQHDAEARFRAAARPLAANSTTASAANR